MKAKELIEVLRKFPSETEISISIDISTGEHDAHQRVFVSEFLEWQEPDTLLFSGSQN